MGRVDRVRQFDFVLCCNFPHERGATRRIQQAGFGSDVEENDFAGSVVRNQIFERMEQPFPLKDEQRGFPDGTAQ